MQLSNGEKFLIHRRRQGLNQEQIAKQYDVHRMTIHYWEKGIADAPKIILNSPLKGYEKCFLTRRRKGMTITGLAKAMGRSHVTIIKMEAGEWSCTPIKKHFRIRS